VRPVGMITFRAQVSPSKSAPAVIWCTRAGDSPAAAASLRTDTPSARAEASAQMRSRSACSRRHAARDTRRSTRRSRRQAAIRSVIVTLTPCPCWGCSAN
jgi:ABC-type nickel/cobalt efflux system permease component RcnA